MELVLDLKAPLCESPIWDDNNQKLFWDDYYQKRIYTYDPTTGVYDFYQLDVMPGSIGLTDKGNIIVAYEKSIGIFNVTEKRFTSNISPEAHISTNHFNDGKCDAEGRFWVGSITETQEEALAFLYRVDSGLEYFEMLDGVITSNGLCWSPDNKVFYYIDTMKFCVDAFDFSIKDGTISKRRTVIDFPRSNGRPDGMTIDEDGMLWIAHWKGASISRWNPYTGECLDIFPVPSYNVTSVYFGGTNRDTLYITTARSSTDEEMLRKYPHSGGLFCFKPGVRGLKSNYFKE